jgi:hypothetical protein
VAGECGLAKWSSSELWSHGQSGQAVRSSNRHWNGFPLSVVLTDATHEAVVVELLVLPAGTDAEVGRKPTAVVDASADAGEAGKWGEVGTPFGTSEEYYRMELPQPFSS